MEIQPEREGIEILPYNIGDLPSSEAAPLLDRAASRLEILQGGRLSEFWQGVTENLHGAGAFIKAEKSKIASTTLKLVAGVSFVATISACARGVERGYILPTEASVATQEIPTKMPLLTQTDSELKVNLSSPPESEEQEFFRRVIIDPEENRLWRMNEKDLEIVGNLPGEFQGWVDKSSVPWASNSENIRYGRWINSGGMGIVEFIEVKEGEYYGGMFIDENGDIWRITDEDYSLTGGLQGNFDGWIPNEDIPEDERENNVRWGLWSNREGMGRVRFERIEATQSQ